VVIVSRKVYRFVPFILIAVLAFSGCDVLFKVEVADCIVSIADFQLDEVKIERILSVFTSMERNILRRFGITKLSCIAAGQAALPSEPLRKTPSRSSLTS